MINETTVNHVGEIVKTKWNERPLYEQNKTQEDIGYKCQPETYPTKLSKSGISPSHLFIWWFQEDRKRKLALENEIDINAIKAAYKGVKNSWFRIVSKYFTEFKIMSESDNYNWEKILGFKEAFKNDNA